MSHIPVFLDEPSPKPGSLPRKIAVDSLLDSDVTFTANGRTYSLMEVQPEPDREERLDRGVDTDLGSQTLIRAGDLVLRLRCTGRHSHLTRAVAIASVESSHG